MSGQTVTFLTVIAAIVFAAATGLWILAIIAAVVIVGTHCAVWTAIDVRREAARRANFVSPLAR
jgi:cell division protein FtsW (lipid II flippase)